MDERESLTRSRTTGYSCLVFNKQRTANSKHRGEKKPGAKAGRKGYNNQISGKSMGNLTYDYDKHVTFAEYF